MRTRGALILLPLLLLVGCQNGPSSALRSRVDNDPLKGIGGPPSGLARGSDRETSPLVGKGPGGPSRPAGPLPTLPSPSGSTSPAALTSGNTGTLDPAPALRIGGGKTAESDQAWSGPGETPRHSFESAPKPPQPMANDVTPPVTIPPLTLTSHRAGEMTLDEMKRRIEGLGVVQPRLEKKNNEIVFTGRVPDSRNPALMHVYEIAGDTEVEVLQAALEQIELDRKR